MQTQQPLTPNRIPFNYTNKPGSQAAKLVKHVEGDKITFVKRKENPRSQSFEAKINDYRDRKQKEKAAREAQKNSNISLITQQYAVLRSQLGTNPDKTQLDALQEKERAAKVVVLKEYVKWYKVSSGWHIDQLEQQAPDFKFETISEEIIQVSDKKTKEVLYEIHFGNSRFTAQANQQVTNEVYQKKDTTKEYVKDANDTFINRYVTRGCTKKQIEELLGYKKILPRNRTKTIGGVQLKKFDFKDRTAQDELSPKELEFVQLRDGSGPDQRFLSVTHANESKTIHSNHGEVFTSEFMIRIDLSKVSKEKIFNQHTNEALNAMVALARLDDKTGALRHNADQELDIVRYSVIKNRETLLADIPINAITDIKVGSGNWMTLDEYRETHDPEIIEQRQKEQEAALEKLRRQQSVEAQKAQKADQFSAAANAVVELIKEKSNRELKKLNLTDNQLDAIKDAANVKGCLENYKHLAKLESSQVKGNLNEIIEKFKDYWVE